MLSTVPMENEIISIYRKIPSKDERIVQPSLQVVFNVGDAPKRVYVKRNAKVIKEDAPVKSKDQRNLKRKRR